MTLWPGLACHKKSALKKLTTIIAVISLALFVSKNAFAAETIYLAFGAPVPKVEIKCDAGGGGITDRRVVGDFDPSHSILEAKANEIRDELARNFKRSGLVVSPDPDGPISGPIDVHLATSFEPLPPYATVEVFFANDNPCLEGIAYSAPLISDSDAHTSRYNQKLPGAFVNLYLAPVVANSATYVARLIAHEVGHTFGLKHIHPDDVDAGQSIMDNRKADPHDALNACITAVTPCTPSYYNGPLKEEGYWWHPFTWRHNPQYHARRWVGGESDQSLRDQCVYPGNWDLKSSDPPAVLQTNHRYEWFPGSGSSLDHPLGGLGAIYDFEVAIEEGRDSMRVVYRQDEVSLDQPLEFDLAVMRSNGFQVFAASAPGGERDIRLALDVPGDDPPVAARAFEDGTTQFELFRFLPNGAEPEPIAMVQVEARNEHVHSDGFEGGLTAALESSQGAPQQCDPDRGPAYYNLIETWYIGQDLYEHNPGRLPSKCQTAYEREVDGVTYYVIDSGDTYKAELRADGTATYWRVQPSWGDGHSNECHIHDNLPVETTWTYSGGVVTLQGVAFIGAIAAPDVADRFDYFWQYDSDSNFLNYWAKTPKPSFPVINGDP